MLEIYLNVNTQDIESMFIEVENFNKNIVIGVVYRPPNQSVEAFIENLDNILTLATSYNMKYTLLRFGCFLNKLVKGVSNSAQLGKNRR